MAACSFTSEGQAVWAKKVKPKLPKFPKTRAGLAASLAVGTISAPHIGQAKVPMMLADAARVQVSVRKMVAGLRWFHTGHIHPPDDGFEVFMLNVAQVGEHFRDPDNVRNFQLATRGVYQDPIVSRTFFYRWAITPENSLWYFVFFRQNVLIAFTGGLPIVGTEPSNDCVNPPAGDGLSAK